jgi:hypothetical protein
MFFFFPIISFTKAGRRRKLAGEISQLAAYQFLKIFLEHLPKNIDKSQKKNTIMPYIRQEANI